MKNKMDIKKIPNFVIFVLLIFVAPLGTWLFYKKTITIKKNIYNKGQNLIWLGLFVMFSVATLLYSKIKEIIELWSSGMSLDMIDLVPDNILLYIIGIIMSVSYLVGAKKIKEQSRKERKLIKLINIDKEYSLKKISKMLDVDVAEIKEHLKVLINCECLIPFEICNNKIVYKDLIPENKKVQCSKCGALINIKKDEYIECDFCGHGIIEEK